MRRTGNGQRRKRRKRGHSAIKLVQLTLELNCPFSHFAAFDSFIVLCREQEIRAAEERLLEKDIPRTADEFERLVRSSPNSSFVWIKYMAFMLSLADIEKARSIAER